MKKVVFLLLSVILVISLFAIPAYAADGDVTIEVTADKHEVHPGDTITYTFTLKHTSSSGVSAVEFAVGDFPSGITKGSAEFDQAAKDAFKGIDGQGGPTFNSNNGHYVFTAASGVTTTEIKLMTLTCTVDKTAKVNEAFAPTVSGLSAVGGDKQAATASPLTAGARVTVTHTEEAHHNFNTDPDETQEATCQALGKKTWNCKTEGCSGTKEETIPKSAHSWGNVEWTWNDANMSASTASVTCSGVGGAPSHTANATKVTATPGESDATCTNPGKTTWSVTAQFDANGDNKMESTTHDVNDQPLGHDFSGVEPQITKPANCETDGEQTITCKRCHGEEEGGVKVETITHPGHHWEAAPVFTWTKTPGNYTASAELKCTTPGLEHSVTDEAEVTSVKTEASCEKAGEIVYTATATFNGQDYTATEKEVLPATGHKWKTQTEPAAPTWTGDPGKQQINDTVKALCDNPNCDKAGGYPLEFTYSYMPDTATCTTTGKIKATAKASIPATTGHNDGAEFTFENEATTNALGHQFAESATFTWPEKAGDDNKATPTGVTATLACTRDNCPAEGKKVTATKVEVTAGQKTEPTYEKDGTYAWTATATFEGGKDGAVTKTGSHSYTIAMLKPTVTDPTVAPQAEQSQTVKDALKGDVLDQVVAALVSDAKGGLSDDLYNALKDAGTKTENGMTVETKLVVNTLQQKPEVIGVDAKNVSSVYDIHIEVTVTGAGVNAKGTIDSVSTPITFTVPVSGNGPIFYVMHDHNGWGKIDSKVVGNNIEFSSSQFSNFAVISSNDLKDAEITGIDPSYTYTGSEIKPAVKVTINGGATELKEGTDYTVEYANNTNVGTATVTIKGIGDYTGSQTINFRIVEAASTSTGTGSTTSGTKTAPNTGDETPVALYAGILTLCAAGLAVIFTKRKKTR